MALQGGGMGHVRGRMGDCFTWLRLPGRSDQLPSGSNSRMRGLGHQRPAQANAPITAGKRNHRGVGRYSVPDSGWARFKEDLCRSRRFENTSTTTS